MASLSSVGWGFVQDQAERGEDGFHGADEVLAKRPVDERMAAST